ncbi:MAG: amidohydrolase [Ruminococcus sp.]|nr:amidohydrolase [Ruminococcus sp.]
MKMRFYNARYLDTDGMEIKSGTVCTDNGVFSYVGEAGGELREGTYDREIDLGGDLMIPGFNNAHAHSPMVFLRSYAEDLPLDKWLNGAVFPNEKRLAPEDVYTLTKLAVCEYVSGGITSCFDMYLFPREMAAAFADCGFRAVFCGQVNDFTSSPEQMEEDHLFLNGFHPLISHKFGFHAEYTTSMEIMKRTADIALKYKAPVWCHNSETAGETNGCVKRYGMSPTELMDSLGMFEYGGGGYHCVYFSEKDMDIFSRKGLTAVTNPASNAKLASGTADLTEFARRGINIAIGTDGAASNNSLDMFREMYLCTVLQKLKHSDPASMPARDVLRAAVTGGARAMGLDNCGNIKKGKNADFTVIRMNRPSMQPENDIISNIVLSGSKDIIGMTAVNGRILYENGEFFIGEDIRDIYSRTEKICGRIFGR